MASPEFMKYKELYAINELAFKTKTDLIKSTYITSICPPFQSFQDPRNKRGSENYRRYLNIGNYISNPQICLDAALGLVNKGEDDVSLPQNLQDIVDYATNEGTNLTTIKNEIISSIFKYGSALIKINIPENVSIANTTPKIEVIEGQKVADFGTFIDDEGYQHFSFVVIDTSRDIFDPNTKYYNRVKLYKILSLDEDGYYYEAEIPQNLYTSFNFERPLDSRENMLSFYQPTWTDPLDFIPAVGINKLNCVFKYGQSFIQDLIETSLHNYRLSCTLGWLELNAAASHLVIKGKNLDDISSYPLGAGAVHVLNDESASESFLTPSTAGMDEIKKHIQENNNLIDSMQYSLLNAGANASGESLQFRISVKCADLVALIKNIGNGITRALEIIDDIVNDGANKDDIEFIPYLSFDKINEFTNSNNNLEENDK